MVFVDRAPSRLTADCVVEDDLGGARTATTHLIDHGHRRIAFIGDSNRPPTTMHRLEGYRPPWRQQDCPLDDDLVHLGDADLTSLERTLAAMAALPDPPTAVFSSNARCTLTVIPALQRLPGPGMALVSFGDFPMAASLQPPVTVIDQDPAAVGRYAAQRLFVRLDHPTKRLRRRTLMPVRLIERASCGQPVGGSAPS